jgi:cytochrome c-type biogenesis protein CcmH
MKFQHERTAQTARLIVLLGLLLSFRSAQAQFSDEPNAEAIRRISNRLLCQCGGCSATVKACPHELECLSRGSMLKIIRPALAAGKSEDAIVASLVEQYGLKILAEPPRQGFSWLGWIMPFAALLLGGGAITYVLWRWKAEPVPDERTDSDGVGGTAGLGLPAAAPGNELVEKYRVQIERELEKE